MPRGWALRRRSTLSGRSRRRGCWSSRCTAPRKSFTTAPSSLPCTRWPMAIAWTSFHVPGWMSRRRGRTVPAQSSSEFLRLSGPDGCACIPKASPSGRSVMRATVRHGWSRALSKSFVPPIRNPNGVALDPGCHAPPAPVPLPYNGQNRAERGSHAVRPSLCAGLAANPCVRRELNIHP